MCNLRNYTKVKIKQRKIKVKVDTCISPVIQVLNSSIHPKTRTLASCCGHNIYHPTIFLQKNGKILEFYSELEVIPQKRRYLCFYQRDQKGYYYNSEIEAYYKSKNQGE